jgi:transcriptional regulator with XRE-family HTH domain
MPEEDCYESLSLALDHPLIEIF